MVYARAAVCNELNLKKNLVSKGVTTLRIGATKTIGEFMVKDKMKKVICEQSGDFTFIIENTTNLLDMINKNELEFAFIEGFFDKTKYDYKLFCQEPFVGICSVNHPFANRSVTMEEIMTQTLIYRENGSGTRTVLEQILCEYNLSIDGFSRQLCISDFPLIKELVADGQGISFVYQAVVCPKDRLCTFSVNHQIWSRELHYVFLQNTNTMSLIEDFIGDWHK